MRAQIGDTRWVRVDEKRPLLKEPLYAVVFEDGTSGFENEPDIIKTEYVREMWWVPNSDNLFPTMEEIMDGIDEFRRLTGYRPDRIVLPNLNGDRIFGVEITQV